MNEAAASRSPGEPTPSRMLDDEISIWEVLAILVRRRATIVLTTITVTALAVVVSLLGTDTYTTQGAFRPQGSELGGSQLLALASQFGVSAPGGGEEASPAFYAELLTSRHILTALVERTFDVDGSGEVLLKDLLEIEEDTEPLRDQAVLDWLVEEALSVSTGRETGTVTLSVTTEWPSVSVTIAEDLLEAVSRFNLDTRASQAAAEREFTERRVQLAEKELETVEDSLRLFLEANRQFENSPMLTFQFDRLSRAVALRQSVLTTLVQSYEQARISEVRDTPVITVLQRPYMPPGPDEQSLVILVAIGLLLGGMMGLVLAFVFEAVRRPSEGDPAREDFRESWENMKRSIPFVGGKA